MNLDFLLRSLLRLYPFQKGRFRARLLAMENLRGRYRLARDSFHHLMLLDTSNYIDGCIYLEGAYEKQSLLSLAQLIEEYKCTLLVDVGANIGVYSIYFAHDPYIRQILAFEPDPRNYAQLMANVFLNECYDRVTAYNLALSASNGTAKLFLSRDVPSQSSVMNTGESSLRFNRMCHNESVDVQVKRFDDAHSFRGQRLAVKIDVEGHELAVLQGMESCLVHNTCVLCLEAYKDQQPFVHRFLSGIGYLQLGIKSTPNYFFYANAR